MIKAYKKLLAILIAISVLSGMGITNAVIAAAGEDGEQTKAEVQTVSEEVFLRKYKK